MPIYEFECRACGKKFEEFFQSMSGAKSAPCPKCKSKRTQRQFSVFGMGGSSKSSGGGSSCSGCSRGSCSGCKH